VDLFNCSIPWVETMTVHVSMQSWLHSNKFNCTDYSRSLWQLIDRISFLAHLTQRVASLRWAFVIKLNLAGMYLGCFPFKLVSSISDRLQSSLTIDIFFNCWLLLYYKWAKILTASAWWGVVWHIFRVLLSNVCNPFPNLKSLKTMSNINSVLICS
jgi:hypothetical protein